MPEARTHPLADEKTADGGNLWCLEGHLHTHASRDGTLSASDVIRTCRARGIDAVVVTDHNEVYGALELAACNQLVVVVGEEILTTEGEIVGLFLSERIPAGLSPQRTVDEVHGQGGIVSVPHPLDSFRKHRIRPEALQTILPSVDVIEVFNSRNLLGSSDRKARELAERLHLPGLVGSDAHTACEIGRACQWVAPFHGPVEFLQSLQQATMRVSRSFLWVHLLSKWRKIRQGA